MEVPPAQASSTPIRKKIAQVPVDPSAQFAANPQMPPGPGPQMPPGVNAQMPSGPGQMGSEQMNLGLQEPVPVPVPTGPGQGQSKAEFFANLDLKNFDIVNVFFVFFAVLIVNSSYFMSGLKHIPMAVDQSGYPNMLTSLIVAIIVTVVYFIINFFKNKK